MIKLSADARSNTKTWLDTYLRNAQLTKDNSTYTTFITHYDKPNYPLERVFKVKNVDLTFAIEQPTSEPMIDSDQTVYGYDEHVGIVTSVVDKVGITGTNLMWKAVRELRYVAETYPLGSHRSFLVEEPKTQNLGSTIIHSVRCVLGYRRDTT